MHSVWQGSRSRSNLNLHPLTQLERGLLLERDLHEENSSLGWAARIERLQVFLGHAIGNFLNCASPGFVGIALGRYGHRLSQLDLARVKFVYFGFNAEAIHVGNRY